MEVSIDAIVVDALYANGRWMTQLDAYGYGGFIVLKKENNEPLRKRSPYGRARKRASMQTMPTQEHIEFWDADEIDTLHTYKGRCV